MEGQNFFAGLLKGFGGGMLDSEQRRQSQHIDGQKQLLDLYLKGIQDNSLDPNLGFMHIAGILQDYLGGGTKGSKNALAALADPENFGQFATGLYTTLGGQKVQTGKVGPTGLPSAGPVPMGGTNPPEMRPQSTTPPDYGYGNRYGSETPKGLGFLGPLQRPDGGVMSEFSIGETINGQEVEMPTVVPTLTREEVDHLLNMGENDPLPESIRQKAVAHARERLAQGKDTFAGPGEQQTLYPDITGPTPPLQSAGLEGRSTMAAPPARLWNTPAEQERQALGKTTRERSATIRGEVQGKVKAAQDLMDQGLAVDMDEALSMLGVRTPAGAGGNINARSLYETDLQTFRSLHGRQPNPTENREMLEGAIKKYKELSGSQARAQQLAPELRERSQQILSKLRLNPATATEEQWTTARTLASEQLEHERTEAAKQKGQLTPTQVVSHSLTLRNMYDRETRSARITQREGANIHSALDAVKKGARTAGSIAAVTSFNTILQPTSVVMLGEFARSEAGLSLADMLRGQAQKIIDGGIGIPDAELEKYVALADAFVENSLNTADSIRDTFLQFADEYKLNKGFIAPSLRPGTPAPATTPAATEPPPANPPPANPPPTTPPPPRAASPGAQRPVPGLTRDPVTGAWVATPVR